MLHTVFCQNSKQYSGMENMHLDNPNSTVLLLLSQNFISDKGLKIIVVYDGYLWIPGIIILLCEIKACKFGNGFNKIEIQE